MNADNKKFDLLFKGEIKKIEKTFSTIYMAEKPSMLYEPINYILRGGGKRIRPFLVLVSAKAVGADFKKVYNAALAVEILHNFTLVHDDIMDNSATRRGRPTLHIRNNVDTAILAGDIMAALAYEAILKDCGDDAKNVLSIFTKAIIEICEGQGYDKEFETQKSVSIKKYKTMIYKKTAALLEMCCLIGASLGKGTPKEIKALGNYGKYLGIAFQIQDDLLDIIADEKELGKPVGGDLAEGKKTYLFLKALEKASGKDKNMLLKVIKNKGVDRKEIKDYKALYEKLGVLEDAKKEIKSYTSKAVASLGVLKSKNEIELLKWLALTLLQRNK
jgi:geranylgeranyl diphosphate synthase type II